MSSGLNALKSFHQWNRHYNGGTFKLSFDEFLKVLQPNQKKLDILIDGLTLGIDSAEMSQSKVDKAMMKMAIASRGKIPSKFTDFFNSLSNESTQVSFIDAVSFTVKESAKDVLNASASLGDSIITTMKIGNFLLPVIAIFVGLWFLNKSTDGSVVGVFREFRKK